MFLFKITTRQYSPTSGKKITELVRHPFKSVFDAYAFVKKLKNVEGKTIEVLHNPMPYLLSVKDVAKYNEAVRVMTLFNS